jgi:glycosyltransferase involved in cell wall biosynthesis
LISVIIPTLNEEKSIGKVIKEVKKYLSQADIVVVNDGSTDLTSEKARASKALVLELPFNLGIGGTMQAGYRYEKAKYEIDYRDYAIFSRIPMWIPT